MDEENIRDAVTELIDAAKRRGSISNRVFLRTARNYEVAEAVLSARFAVQTGRRWEDYRIRKMSQDDLVKLAVSRAQDRIKDRPTLYNDYGKEKCGRTFTVHRRIYAYVGLRIKYRDFNVFHEVIRVSDMETKLIDWPTAYSDFPALVDLYYSAT